MSEILEEVKRRVRDDVVHGRPVRFEEVANDLAALRIVTAVDDIRVLDLMAGGAGAFANTAPPTCGVPYSALDRFDFKEAARAPLLLDVVLVGLTVPEVRIEFAYGGHGWLNRGFSPGSVHSFAPVRAEGCCASLRWCGSWGAPRPAFQAVRVRPRDRNA
jgi:hypothetical protein